MKRAKWTQWLGITTVVFLLAGCMAEITGEQEEASTAGERVEISILVVGSVTNSQGLPLSIAQ